MRRVFRGRVVFLLVIFLVTVLPQLIQNIMDYDSGKSYAKGFLVFWVVMFILYAFMLVQFAWKYYTFKKKVVR